MKRLLLMVVLLLIFITPQAWALTTTQYPNPYRQTMWNNFTDSVHTLGQTHYQAKLTKMKLHGARTKARLRSIYLANKAKRRGLQSSNN